VSLPMNILCGKELVNFELLALDMWNQIQNFYDKSCIQEEDEEEEGEEDSFH
jgi:hypothetical protein